MSICDCNFEYNCNIHQRDCRCSYKAQPCNPCRCCCPGPRGADGRSAYQIALSNGFVGTEIDWLNSLKGATGPAAPFRSSYLEAVGSAQTVATGANVVFDTDVDAIDFAGMDIAIDATGTTFTIRRAGLYHVEWSVNLASADSFVTIGLLENGQPSSAMANAVTNGNCSSGGIINVTQSEIPYTINLHNFGGPIRLADADRFQNIAASIRIVRFADSPN